VERDGLLRELEQLKSDFASVNQGREILSKDLLALKAEHDELLGKLSGVEKSHSALVSRKSALEDEVRQALDELDQRNQKVGDLERELAEVLSRSPHAGGQATPEETISLKTKEKFTRLYNSYEKERGLRKQAEQFLTEAEEQITQLRNALRQLRNQTKDG
jgi:chromosome segregation ATPase